MRKSYFITALAVCLALVTAQAQETVVKRTTARKAAKMALSERFVRVAKARGGEGTVVQKAATLPITPDWECKFDKEADFNQFTVIDGNGDRFPSSYFDWGTWNYLYKAGDSPYGSDYPDHCAGYTSDEDHDADDWLITPALALKAGNTYKVTYKVRAHRSSMPERLEVKYGTAATAAGMTQTLMAKTDIANAEYVEYSQELTPVADGTYYIGFHAVSDADNMILYLDDVSVKKSAGAFKGWECNFDKEADFNQFTVVDSNGDRAQSSYLDWGVWNYLFKSGDSPYGPDFPDHCAGYGCDEDHDADDWLITPVLKLTGGDTYIVKYKVRAHWARTPERLEVKYGTAATAAGMTQTLMARTDISNTEYQEYTQTMTPAADGDYYIGFHAVSDADNMILYLDDISVKKLGALPPAAVTEAVLTPDATGAVKATLSFKAPDKATDGSALTKLSGVKVMEDDAELADITSVQVGKTATYTIENAGTKPANHTYTLIPYNADGNGEKTVVSGWIGLDGPTAPAGVTAEPVGKNLKVAWEASKAEHGGVFFADKVKYNLYEMKDAATASRMVATTTGATEVPVAVDANSGDQQLLQLAVSASNATGVSDYSFAAPLVVGAPYTLPLKETFAKAGNAYGFWAAEGDGWGYQNQYAGVSYSTDEDANGDGGCADIKTYYQDVVALVSGKIALGSAEKPMFMYSQKTDSKEGSVRPLVIKADGTREYLATESLDGYADASKWVSRSYDLSAYKGQKWIRVGVAFDQSKRSYRNQHLYIDNFVVADETPKSITVSVSAPAKMRKGKAGTVKVAVTNYGNAIGAYTLTLTAGDTEVKSVGGESLALMQTATYDIAYTPSVLVKGNAVTLTATLKAGEGKDAVTADGSVELTAVDAHQPAPTGLKALVDAQGKVSLSWTAVAKVDRMTDDFEDYNSWSVDNAGDWSFHDGDKGVTYGYFDDQGLYYENEKTPFAYIVWTPANYGGEDITVANPTAKPYSGSNAMASVYSYNRKATGELTPLAADNWMISPELTGKAQTVMFRVNNISASKPETYQVLYSTTTAAHDQFQLVAERTVSNSKWDEVSFELPEGARYFAIRHNTKLEVSPSGIGYSSAPYLFLVDDATFASKGCTFVEYVIYRDGKPLATATATASEDREAQCDGADHVYQVTARYGDGSESAPVEAVVSMPTGIDVIETTVDAPQSVYSLDGVKQDANARLQRGVYIKNGKKVVVR